jgi:spermidine/putrescine transport system permease protein
MRRRASHLLLTGHAAGVYALLYAPLGVLVVFSFNRARQTAAWEGFTLDWYGRMLANRPLLDSIVNSMIVAGATTALSLLIGVPAGIALGRRRLGRAAAAATESLVHLPLVVPEIVLGVGLLSLFALAGAPLGLDTVVAAHVAFCASYVVMLVRARVAGMDMTLQQAAVDLGAPAWDVFHRVTLPQLAPALLAAALLVFTLSLDDYLITSFVAGVGSSTLPLRIYSMVKVGVSPEINAVSTLLLAVTTAAILVAHRLLHRHNER